VDPVIHSEYTPRQDPRALWNQYLRYGLGKSEMLWVNGRLPSLRPLAPAVLVVGLSSTAIAGLITKRWWPFILGLGSWLTIVGTVAVRSRESFNRVMAAAVIMHVSYGIGVIQGLVRGPRAVRHLRS
jgi:succinoglycan biosynthesis protein ExoA